MDAISLKDDGVIMAPRVSVKTVLAVSALSILTVFATWRARVLEIALEQPLNVRAPAPDFRAQTIDGKSVSLGDFRGRR